MLQEYKLAFGESFATITLHSEQVIEFVEGKTVPELTDIPAAARVALRQPLGTPPLQQIVAAGEKVVLVASDITRSWIRNDLFLPTILNELNAAGIPDRDISLLVALGAHRQHTDAENVQVYGQEAVARIQIYQNKACQAAEFVRVGKTSHGVEVSLNKRVVAADRVILLGGIVYHLMAGFGGGRKSILPGIAAYDTIQANHRLCLHPEVGKGVNPHCAAGNCVGNAMHEDIMEIAAMLAPTMIFNVVLTPEGKFAGFFAGHWQTAWEAGCRRVVEIFGVKIKGKADLVIASAGGFPKDINLYQGSKSIDNAAAAVKEGGVIILLMECRDIAEPPDFSKWFAYDSLYERELELRKAFTVPGYIALKCGLNAAKAHCIVVTLPQNKAFIEKAGMLAAADLAEAMLIAKEKLNTEDYTVTIMPHAANTVPLLAKA